MTFKDLPVGEVFQFDFDRGTRWVYEKISDTMVKAVSSLADDDIGAFHQISEFTAEGEVIVVAKC